MNKFYFIFGLVRTGIAAAKLLQSEGHTVVAWDDNAATRVAFHHELPAIALKEPALVDWQQIHALILSPGVPFTHPAPHPVVVLAHTHHVPVWCDIELLYQRASEADFIGITGTNGKSTTTALIAHILRHAGRSIAMGGNIGVAAGSLPLLSAKQAYVLEMSSYQLDLLADTRFSIAALLNITPDHLDRHGSMEGYIAAKMRIFRHSIAGDSAVVAVDDTYTQQIADSLENTHKVIRVSNQQMLKNGIAVKEGVLWDGLNNDSPIAYALPENPSLIGEHNKQNLAVAWAVCRAYGISAQAILAAIPAFIGLSHRVQYIGASQGIRFFNDSKATNADATSHALKSFAHIYWIAGGVAKAGGITSLSPYFSRVHKAYLIGEAAEAFAATLREENVAYGIYADLAEATHAAWKDAKQDTMADAAIVLSPACASFDMFQSYEHRGECFIEIVKQLLHN